MCTRQSRVTCTYVRALAFPVGTGFEFELFEPFSRTRKWAEVPGEGFRMPQQLAGGPRTESPLRGKSVSPGRRRGLSKSIVRARASALNAVARCRQPSRDSRLVVLAVMHSIERVASDLDLPVQNGQRYDRTKSRT